MSKYAGSPGPQHPVGEDVRVRRAALARDRVDALDVLGAELEEHLVDERDAVVLAEARAASPCRARRRPRRPSRTPSSSSVISSCVLILRTSCISAWPSTTCDAGLLQREQHRQLDEVDAERLVRAGRAPRARRGSSPRPTRRGPRPRRAASRCRRASARRREPRAVERVVPRGRAEVPQDRLAVLRQQAEADQLVDTPTCRCGSP